MTNPWKWFMGWRRARCSERAERDHRNDVVKVSEDLLQLRWEAERLELHALASDLNAALGSMLARRAQ